MQIHNVCVLGGTGFVGAWLVHALHEAGKSVRVLTRRRERHRHLLVLPRVELVEANVFDERQLGEQLRGMDAVVNLVGVLNDSRRPGHGFRDAHVALTRQVVQCSLDAGVRRLLHMSALHADAGSGSSLYLRTKGEAENHAHTFAGRRLAVTSFRPSVIFGPGLNGAGDGLFNRFARLLRLTPVLPLACPNARFAPVYVKDVTRSFVQALESRASFDRHIDLCGPEVFTLREIVEYTRELIGARTLIVPLPDWLSRVQATLLEFAPGKPFTRDNYDSLQTDSVCEDADPQPTPVGAVVPHYLKPSSRHHRYQSWRRQAGR